MTPKVKGCVAFVTGSNQGIGRGFVEVLLNRGAARVYATARRPDTLAKLVALDPNRVVPVTLDVTEPAQRLAAFEAAQDVTLLINNAGIPGGAPAQRRFLSASDLADPRAVMETNFFAPAELCRLFKPVILSNGGGAVVNILSIGALFCVPEYASYSASKAAAMMMTNGLRAELDGRNILVSGVYTGSVATRMSEGNDKPKMSPVEHAHQVLDAVETGEEHIFAGSGSSQARDAIRADPIAFEKQCITRFKTNPLG